MKITCVTVFDRQYCRQQETFCFLRHILRRSLRSSLLETRPHGLFEDLRGSIGRDWVALSSLFRTVRFTLESTETSSGRPLLNNPTAGCGAVAVVYPPVTSREGFPHNNSNDTHKNACCPSRHMSRRAQVSPVHEGIVP